ncbi:helix-turn-helix domain-containing protein [Streptomyces seoulensis]
MEQGYSTREAARIVGINLRTGKKWRNGHHSPGNGKKPVPLFSRSLGNSPKGRVASGNRFLPHRDTSARKSAFISPTG